MIVFAHPIHMVGERITAVMTSHYVLFLALEDLLQAFYFYFFAVFVKTLNWDKNLHLV
ncbi:hypothetical protein [Pajaroellobacter abortibovis]|uniref:hypothetical protein n=1 Tax=Pajaroellobacter abortibovis TaxID=1882918 RepID=UPI0012EB2294|nr:hypothetical protein [Pajaroellobacter abortibovis]